MHLPIILDYEGDIVTCSSLDDAHKIVEASDVRAGNVLIYDARGQQLEARIDRHFLAQRVSIHQRPGGADGAGALKVALTRYLNASGVNGIDEFTLEQLVSEVEKRQAKSPE